MFTTACVYLVIQCMSCLLDCVCVCPDGPPVPLSSLSLYCYTPSFCFPFQFFFSTTFPHCYPLSAIAFLSLLFSFYSTLCPSSSSSPHAENSFSGKRPYSLRKASTSVAKNSLPKCLVTNRKLPSNSPALYTSRAGRTWKEINQNQNYLKVVSGENKLTDH